MQLTLQREVLTSQSSIGKLTIDGEFLCWTLEDVVRHGPKVFGRTAIPEGRYQLVITDSVRFKRRLPLLKDVPGFEGIRIHPGNTDADTDGCILLGLTKFTDFISKSREAMALFMPRLEAALQDGQECWIEVRNP